MIAEMILQREMERILRKCALCDAHGFLVTAKHGDEENGQEARQRLNKETLIDFSYAPWRRPTALVKPRNCIPALELPRRKDRC